MESAEAILLHIQQILAGDYTDTYRERKLKELSDEFYGLIPHKKSPQISTENQIQEKLVENKLFLILI